MSQPMSDGLKAQAIHSASMPSGEQDPSLHAIFDSLQLSDSNVEKILQGEVNVLMERLAFMITDFQQNAEEYKNFYMTANQEKAEVMLLKLLGVQKDVKKTVADLETELEQYRKMVPYLLMLSRLMWLSNLSAKQVRDIQFRQSIMIQRDRCLRGDDADGVMDDNFLDALEILMHNQVAGGERGWKSNVLRNEVREVRTTIEDRTSGGEPRRKKWGIF